MAEIKSRHFRKSRLKNLFRFSLKKIAKMGTLIIVGEYMLLNFINISLSEQTPPLLYNRMPSRIINLAVSEKPILKVAQACDNIKDNIDFDHIIHRQYPVHVKGTRPDFRTLNLQDTEGAKIGYVVKF